MADYNGTAISSEDRETLIRGAGRILDQYNDNAAGLTGTAFESGLRLWDTPEGCVMEYPKTVAEARTLAPR